MPSGKAPIMIVIRPQNENRHSGPSCVANVLNGMNVRSSGTDVSAVHTSWLPVPRRPSASHVSRTCAVVLGEHGEAPVGLAVVEEARPVAFEHEDAVDEQLGVRRATAERPLTADGEATGDRYASADRTEHARGREGSGGLDLVAPRRVRATPGSRSSCRSAGSTPRCRRHGTASRSPS